MIYFALILIGSIAGFVNNIAGGGSLLTLPILIFMGLPPVVANGTNRIAILAGALSGSKKFKAKGYFEIKESLYFGIPAVIGAIIGSKIAVNLSDEKFNKFLGLVMIVMLFIIIFQPHKKIKSMNNKNILLGSFLFFLVGIYGGVIQAGVGFLIITTLVLVTDYSLVKINSIKLLIVLIYTIPALFIFISSGNMDISKGVVLALGNSIGAYLGSGFQIKNGDRIVKLILTISILFMSLKLTGLIKF